jgi:hypothetical protein
MGDVVVLAFTAALNPTELAATTVMLLLPGPQQLMFGYWLGAMLTGITCGLVIVFALEGNAEHTTTRTVGPVVWLAVAALLVLAAFALGKGQDTRLRERRAARREKNGEERRHRMAKRHCRKEARGARSWSGSCSRSRGPPTSPLWTG